MNSSYSIASKSFQNLENISISIHKVKDINILNFIKIFYEIVKSLNKTDEEDLVLISQLWVCKTIINSTLINYNDPALMLIERSNNV